MSFTDNAEATPMGEALRSLGVPHAFFARRVSLNYRSRLQLLFLRLPRLLLHAAAAAHWSLKRAPVPAQTVVVSPDLEAVVFGLIRWWYRRDVKIALLGFILTQRNRPWLDALRLKYFRQVFRLADVVLCYSNLERQRYCRLFPELETKFHFLHFGLHIWAHEEEHDFVEPASGPVLSAGRSGRDYTLLTTALANKPRELRIVCDSAAALEGYPRAPNIVVLRDCHGDDYIKELRAAASLSFPSRLTMSLPAIWC